jgi:hypothetical protein
MHALTPYLALALALGIPVALFIWCKRTMDGRKAAIVVVDRRTLKLALRRINEAHAAGNDARVLAGLTAASAWLGGEIATGPRRHRAEYVLLKTEVDARRDRAKLTPSPDQGAAVPSGSGSE